MTSLTLYLLPVTSFALEQLELEALPWSPTVMAYAASAPERRQQILLGRLLLTMAASEQTGAPLDIVAVTEMPGRCPSPLPGWYASLAHSDDWLAMVVSSHHPCGVDIEARRDIDLLALAQFAFTPADAAEISTAPVPLQQELFYQCWTVREAAFKAGLRERIEGPPDMLPWLEYPNVTTGQQGELFWAVVSTEPCSVRGSI